LQARLRPCVGVPRLRARPQGALDAGQARHLD
jgi:hypothetical protein